MNAKQRSLIELLETKGPQDTERLSLFLEINPRSVPAFIYEVNRRIPKLIENLQGRYVSRLAKLFPVTEEAKAEANELEDLRKQLEQERAHAAHWKQSSEALRHGQDAALRTIGDLNRKVQDLERRLKEQISASPPSPKAVEPSEEIPPGQGSQPTEPLPQGIIPVEVTLRRTLTSFNVSWNKEVLDIDESSWEGKILARGLEGFFQEPKGIGKIMAELVRRYNVGDSGGNRTTVNDRLAMLVSKGILDRKQEAGQWVYLATPEFKERVRK